MRLLPLFILMATLYPTNSEAWGAGMHIVQGSAILNSVALLKPAIGAVISEFPLDYLYGCISADIFIGKGYKRRDDHCHNWNVGLGLLDSAEKKSGREAYAYGYISHLAADVIAHNYLVPNLLYMTPSGKRLGHVYWEFRADRLINKKYWKRAVEVVSRHNSENDSFIKEAMNGTTLFGTKKNLFKRSVQLSDVTTWYEHVDGSAKEGKRLTVKYVSIMNNHSINLAIDLLLKGDKSIALKYDPVGTDNTIASKKLRRADKKDRVHNRKNGPFALPEEITDLAYIDLDQVIFAKF